MFYQGLPKYLDLGCGHRSHYIEDKIKKGAIGYGIEPDPYLHWERYKILYDKYLDKKTTETKKFFPNGFPTKYPNYPYIIHTDALTALQACHNNNLLGIQSCFFFNWIDKKKDIAILVNHIHKKLVTNGEIVITQYEEQALIYLINEFKEKGFNLLSVKKRGEFPLSENGIVFKELMKECKTERGSWLQVTLQKS